MGRSCKCFARTTHKKDFLVSPGTFQKVVPLPKNKNFSFCEQTLHKGLIDASCNWLQSTRKNRGQNIFLRKLRAKIQFPGLLFSLLRYISSYNPHTILKKYATRSTKKYIYFYSQELQVGPVDAACRERQYATKNRARTNFLRKI